MSAIPEGFSTLMFKQYGSEATEWVETLPERLTACAAFFKLRELKPFEQLTYNYVAEGITNQESVVLKVSYEKASLKKEKEVLEAFVDKGVIRVLGYSEPLGGLLLEKVTPGRPLTEIGNDEKEVAQFCRVFTRLHGTKEIRNCTNATPLTHWFDALKRYNDQYGTAGPLPKEAQRFAGKLLSELIRTTENPVLLHGDLHHDNILNDEKDGWKVIDPKGIIGDIHFETIQYLLNYVDRNGDPDAVLKRRVQSMSSQLNLDRERMIKWGIVRGMLEACWALESGGDFKNGLEIMERFKRQLNVSAD